MKTAFVTGASSGIGRALALELAAGGVHVAIAARREPELREVAELVESRGGRALVVPLDVADPAAVKAAVARADQELGSLDLVVANAGVSHAAAAPLLSVEQTSTLVDINVRGALATLVAAIPAMMAQKRGHLVGVSSLAGRRGLPGFGAYSASKAALSTFLETLRVELAPMGIHVTDVQPGFVETPLVQKGLHPTPFMWPVERAAKHIVKKLASAPPVVAFPFPLAALTAFSRWLPSFVFDPVMRALAR